MTKTHHRFSSSSHDLFQHVPKLVNALRQEPADVTATGVLLLVTGDGVLLLAAGAGAPVLPSDDDNDGSVLAEAVRLLKVGADAAQELLRAVQAAPQAGLRGEGLRHEICGLKDEELDSLMRVMS